MDNVLSELVKKLEKGESVSNLVSEFKIPSFAVRQILNHYFSLIL